MEISNRELVQVAIACRQMDTRIMHHNDYMELARMFEKELASRPTHHTEAEVATTKEIESVIHDRIFDHLCDPIDEWVDELCRDAFGGDRVFSIDIKVQLEETSE